MKNFSQEFDTELKKLANQDTDMKYMARRAFNSYCRAYSLLKDKECFNLKNMNLHKISKSYGLISAKSKGDLEKKEYTEMKESKKISKSEETFLEQKKKKMEIGRKVVQSKNYMIDEFAN